MVRTVRMLAAAVLLSVGGAAARAQDSSTPNCIAYRVQKSGYVVHGAFVRTSDPAFWIEANSDSSSAIQWVRTFEANGVIKLRDPSHLMTVRIDLGRRVADEQRDGGGGSMALAIVFVQ